MSSLFRFAEEAEERRFIYLAKGFAIFSVICAHTAVANSTSNTPMTISLLKIAGSIGVIIFFILSGFLFAKNTKNIKMFWLKKLKTIIIPWFFCGTLVYFVSQLFGNNKRVITCSGYFNFLFGNGSYLYFMTILCADYLIFFFIVRMRKILACFIVINLASLILTIGGWLWYINPYLNIFNWCGFFALGIMLNNHCNINSLFKWIRKYMIPITIMFILTQVLTITSRIKIVAYFGPLSIFTEVTGVLLVFVLCNSLSRELRLIQDTGRLSFTIYLLHMPAAGLINMIGDYFSITLIYLLKPFFVISITYFFIKCIEKISIVNEFCKLFSKIMGIPIPIKNNNLNHPYPG